jgi:regulator of cell morphogenesis and NO signaling
MTEPSNTLAQLVTERASRAKELDRIGLDYCCHGDDTLEHACASAGIDANAVIEVLAGVEPLGDAHDCAELPPAELIAHLLSEHHAYLHRELPELTALAEKVWRVHGARHPELERVWTLVVEISDDLEPHMLKEERVLFPSILQLTKGSTEFPFGSIRNPVAVMRIEHEGGGQLLAELRDCTDEYTVPDDGCASYHSLYERLAALEHDTHLHVFEENHLLFPRAVALEAATA